MMTATQPSGKPYLLSGTDLSQVDGKMLFYPCSGDDLMTPVELFSPRITTFFFVDCEYFCSGSQAGLSETRPSAEDTSPLLRRNDDYRLLSTRIEGLPTQRSGCSRAEFKPCRLYETYRHVPSNREITVIRKRSFGRYTFREEVGEIGVFFYRGDSEGEGGSGDMWLKQRWIEEILKKLVDGGFLVTDGSNHGRFKIKKYKYQELVRYHSWACSEGCSDIEGALGRRFHFEAGSGRNSSRYLFDCVGYAGVRYGDTFAWQITKCGSEPAATRPST